MTDEASRQFHTRVLAGSKTVSTELWLRYQPRLVRAMQATFPALAEEEIQDICTDVILNYVERPEQYDPEAERGLGSPLHIALDEAGLLAAVERIYGRA